MNEAKHTSSLDCNECSRTVMRFIFGWVTTQEVELKGYHILVLGYMDADAGLEELIAEDWNTIKVEFMESSNDHVDPNRLEDAVNGVKVCLVLLVHSSKPASRPTLTARLLLCRCNWRCNTTLVELPSGKSLSRSSGVSGFFDPGGLWNGLLSKTGAKLCLVEAKKERKCPSGTVTVTS